MAKVAEQVGTSGSGPRAAASAATGAPLPADQTGTAAWSVVVVYVIAPRGEGDSAADRVRRLVAALVARQLGQHIVEGRGQA